MYQLVTVDNKLSLVDEQNPKQTPITIDFLAGKLAHRRQYGGGKGQLIAKAVGVKRYGLPQVTDVTAGLGEDAFTLACLGCPVIMVERHPMIAALLEDALMRFYQDAASEGVQLSLVKSDALAYLKQLPEAQFPDVIYCDPMFPESKKSAQVKQAMRILRQCVGADEDAADLLVLARQIAKKRVVVKRPRLAPPVADEVPDLVFKGQSGRFDIYL